STGPYPRGRRAGARSRPRARPGRALSRGPPRRPGRQAARRRGATIAQSGMGCARPSRSLPGDVLRIAPVFAADEGHDLQDFVLRETAELAPRRHPGVRAEVESLEHALVGPVPRVTPVAVRETWTDQAAEAFAMAVRARRRAGEPEAIGDRFRVLVV